MMLYIHELLFKDSLNNPLVLLSAAVIGFIVNHLLTVEGDIFSEKSKTAIVPRHNRLEKP